MTSTAMPATTRYAPHGARPYFVRYRKNAAITAHATKNDTTSPIAISVGAITPVIVFHDLSVS